MYSCMVETSSFSLSLTKDLREKYKNNLNGKIILKFCIIFYVYWSFNLFYWYIIVILVSIIMNIRPALEFEEMP